MFSLDDYDYELPEELIAQEPLPQRDQSRLLFMDRKSGVLKHLPFKALYDLLGPSDILVVNNTEVIPGRLNGHKETGGKVEVLILNYAGRLQEAKRGKELVCECLIKTSKRLQKGTAINFDQGLKAAVLDFNNSIYTLKFTFKSDFETLLYQIGKVPLPPYIKREPGENIIRDDRATYQTVYATQRGAIAAPTAGFHFTEALLAKIRSKGIKILEVTLHIGYGTFLPVRVADIRRHRMHVERYRISKSVAETINHAKAIGSRIIAVGTTCVRTLEFSVDSSGDIVSGNGDCNLFIYPGYRFKIVDALLTNFHLPKSSLLMLISAFADRSRIMKAYQEAIQQRYRFYSYGDAMFIA